MLRILRRSATIRNILQKQNIKFVNIDWKKKEKKMED